MGKETILVVDDESINVDVIVSFLQDLYEVKVAFSGKKAIEIAQKIDLDLILLDISMPELNGFEVARILKNDDKTKEIPIIFTTGRSDDESIEQAFSSGGSDYIAKPIRSKELQVRIEKELHLRSAMKELQDLNGNLESKVEEKTEENLKQKEQLFHQSKQAAMGDLIGVIAHQLKQPLNGINVLSYIIREDAETEELDFEKLKRNLNKIDKSVSFMSESIDDLRNFFRKDKIKREFNLKNTIEKTLQLLSIDLMGNKISLDLQLQENLLINSFENELQQVILNIVTNGKDILIERNIEKPSIGIKTKWETGFFIIDIVDNGGGIPKEVLPSIFDSYFSTKGSKGTGIGLHLSRMIIEESLEGKIEAKNTENGALFTIKIPKDQQGE